MKKRFAARSSEGPDLSNVQLKMWRLAVEQYDALERLSEEDEPDENILIEQGAVVVVLAGASLTALVGQNVEHGGKKVPSPCPVLKQELAADEALVKRVERFFAYYDDIRHFGEPKHQKIGAMNEELLAEFMETAQEVWQHYLTKAGDHVGEEFQHEFSVEE